MLAKNWKQKGSVVVLSNTEDEPISLMGELSAICYKSNNNSNEKNFQRGLNCLESGHMRVAEFPKIYFVIDGWSAKVIRELYTHITDVTRLQDSTRYIDFTNFDYVVPPAIKNNDEANRVYCEEMSNIMTAMGKLTEMGFKKEDVSGLLPLNYKSKMVICMGLREFINICQQRLCSRAYHEMRNLINAMIEALKVYSDQYKQLYDLGYFAPKCEFLGYCPELKGCGRYKKREVER